MENEHKYEVDIYKEGNWQCLLMEEEDIQKVDKILFQLTKLEYQVQVRILKDDKVLVFLNNSDYQYLYWKNVYVREKGEEFHTEKIYEKKLRKKKNKKKSK